MTKDDIIGRIITLVHAEVQTLAPTADTLGEGISNAPARTVILERLVNDITTDSPDGLVDLMDVLNDRAPKTVYPEVRLLQQWQNMSILETPMDNYYAADLLFSKQRAGIVLIDAEIKELSAIANINVQHPWPAGYSPVQTAPTSSAPSSPMDDAAFGGPSLYTLGQPNASTSSNPEDLIIGDIHGVALDPAFTQLINDITSPETGRISSADANTTAGPSSVIRVAVDNPAPEEEAPVLMTPTPAPDGIIRVAVDAPEDERVRTNPVAAYQEKRGMIEDVALVNGLAVLSGKEWRTAKMPRNQAVMVADFDYSTIDKDGVGRAAYLIVGPTSADDVRIELKSQSTSGSAGDKLPTSLLRMVNAAKSNSYGSAVVGVVGLQYFAPEALTLAREVASRSSRVRLVEGAENFVDVVQQSITSVKALHAASPAVSVATPAVVASPVASPVAPAPSSSMDDAAFGGPSLYSLGSPTP